MKHEIKNEILWKNKMGLAIWNYRLYQPGSKDDYSRLLNPDLRARYLQEIAGHILKVLDDFAKPKKAAISTISLG